MNLSPRQNEVGSVLARLAWLWLAPAALGGIACSESTAPMRAAQIVPASATVALQATPQGNILNTSVTITNTSSRAVAYSFCGASLEKKGLPALPPGTSEWKFVWSQLCAVLEISGEATMPTVSPAFDQIILQPGASATIPIYAVAGQQPYPEFTGEPGLYRVRVPLAVELLGRFFPAEPDQSVSDPFEVIPAQ